MKTIRELQENLPWGAHEYGEAYIADPRPVRDFGHACLHVQKALGKIAGLIDDHDHLDRVGQICTGPQPEVGKYLADIVICALRMANTNPEGVVDLGAAIDQRLADKFPPVPAYVEGHARSLPVWRMQMGAQSEVHAGAPLFPAGNYRYHDWRGKRWYKDRSALVAGARGHTPAARPSELVYWSDAQVDRTDPGVCLGVIVRHALGGGPDIVSVCALSPECEVQP